MNIEIVVYDENGDVIAQRHSSSFEGAAEDLGKLERYFYQKEQELVDRQKYEEVFAN